MASIYPFRAWRYNPSVVHLQDVVTQPYDKISPAMQEGYYQRSPYNLVRIILGLPELFDAERGENVYSRAARDFKAWRRQGILVQEKTPASSPIRSASLSRVHPKSKSVADSSLSVNFTTTPTRSSFATSRPSPNRRAIG